MNSQKMSYQQNPQTYSILNISESQKDFLSGSLGGASSVLLGYPFE